MSTSPIKALPLTFVFLSMAALVMPVQGQYGPGGGGGGGGGGIPLGGGGSRNQDDGDKVKDDKKSASERPVSGVVTDGDGNPITGAVVQLKDTKTLKIRSIITHEKGEYLFTGLNKSLDYEVTALFKDHSSGPHTLSTFDSRAKPVINLQIK